MKIVFLFSIITCITFGSGCRWGMDPDAQQPHSSTIELKYFYKEDSIIQNALELKTGLIELQQAVANTSIKEIKKIACTSPPCWNHPQDTSSYTIVTMDSLLYSCFNDSIPSPNFNEIYYHSEIKLDRSPYKLYTDVKNFDTVRSYFKNDEERLVWTEDNLIAVSNQLNLLRSKGIAVLFVEDYRIPSTEKPKSERSNSYLDFELPWTVGDTYYGGWVEGWVVYYDWKSKKPVCSIQVQAESSDRVEFSYWEGEFSFGQKAYSAKAAIKADLARNLDNAIKAKTQYLVTGEEAL